MHFPGPLSLHGSSLALPFFSLLRSRERLCASTVCFLSDNFRQKPLSSPISISLSRFLFSSLSLSNFFLFFLARFNYQLSLVLQKFARSNEQLFRADSCFFSPPCLFFHSSFPPIYLRFSRFVLSCRLFSFYFLPKFASENDIQRAQDSLSNTTCRLPSAKRFRETQIYTAACRKRRIGKSCNAPAFHPSRLPSRLRLLVYSSLQFAFRVSVELQNVIC